MPFRIPKRRPAILLLALLGSAAFFAVGTAADESSPVSTIDPSAEAVLIVDGINYEFDLDTCFVGDDSFVVAGHGRQGDQDFRVLASPSHVELAFGVIEESAPVPDDSLWFGTKDSVSWSADQSVVTARLNLIERLDERQTPRSAELSIDCGGLS